MKRFITSNLSTALVEIHKWSPFLILFSLFTESIYRRGARRWRKLYYASGHAFQAKRFNRVRRDYEFCRTVFHTERPLTHVIMCISRVWHCHGRIIIHPFHPWVKIYCVTRDPETHCTFKSFVFVCVFKGEWDIHYPEVISLAIDWWSKRDGGKAEGFNYRPSGLHVSSPGICVLACGDGCSPSVLLSSEPIVPSARTASGVWEDKATNASTANCWCTRSVINWSQWSVADRWSIKREGRNI